MSQQLFGNQIQNFESSLSNNKELPIYYFVASGRKDAPSRVKLESNGIFKLNKNRWLKTSYKLYNTDHVLEKLK